MKKFILLLSLVILICGCSQNLARFSIVSTGATPLANNVQKGEYVTGSDCIRRILFFTFGNKENRISGAVADALEKAAKKGLPADALINVDISTSYTNLFLYESDCIDAKGQAVGL
ncbi:MAG: hypothetical protein IJM92_01040 [Fibrobacter sp.]|jgi:hypothetical protein|uniref:hypothetical protein n=1 Tax=Fibrobacter sp. TaxID=35828 RepID=UPI0013D7D7A6|nr:hypothetical protein [Fibrobacter sp.]MBQ7078261.1 hypothetical protein [Fibrobacter sp.]